MQTDKLQTAADDQSLDNTSNQGWILSDRSAFCEAQVTRSYAELLGDVQYAVVEAHSRWFVTASYSLGVLSKWVV